MEKLQRGEGVRGKGNVWPLKFDDFCSDLRLRFIRQKCFFAQRQQHTHAHILSGFGEHRRRRRTCRRSTDSRTLKGAPALLPCRHSLAGPPNHWILSSRFIHTNKHIYTCKDMDQGEEEEATPANVNILPTSLLIRLGISVVRRRRRAASPTC